MNLKVSTSELAVPPNFMRSKSASSMAAVGGITADNLSRVSSNTSNSGAAGNTSGGRRGRSSSILSMHEIKENYDDDLDQGALGANLNADWVNYKGRWKHSCCCAGQDS